jgi:cell division protein FtsL
MTLLIVCFLCVAGETLSREMVDSEALLMPLRRELVDVEQRIQQAQQRISEAKARVAANEGRISELVRFVVYK